METQELIAALGYAESPHFLSAPRFDEVPTHAQVFRRAARRCSLQGVYLLRDESAGTSPATPLVYIAEADDLAAADSIHRQVWNQSSVPFLIVCTPRGVRLYSGFAYQKSPDPEQPQEGVLETLVDFHEVSLRLAAFRADQIDNGGLWRSWGDKVQPEKRVDHRLLSNLEAIGRDLHKQGVPREVAHALIGKLVYLRYLRDRDILSNRRLRAWNIREEQVFGRDLEVSTLHLLVEQVDHWLNGEIFPLSFSGDSRLSREHIEQTAAVFLGDDPRTGQLHLDFQAYDFSYIPIETLSTIYEQFLAIEGTNRESGAFYTPVPLVNFMVAEMEDHKPLESGMRVLDPSCGSGAFLVQCYRHLIEKRMAKVERRLRPVELRDILVQQIFGVDRDGDACRVAQMSLVLTMLDYIDPPDLQSTPSFKLPKLHNNNIYQSDFFDEASAWVTDDGARRYDWIIGNPPWVVQSTSDHKSPLQLWLTINKVKRPVNRGQSAEAFAWKALDSVTDRGVIGLLLPAMTLFKQESTAKLGFRQAFFRSAAVLTVANFTNLREVLFTRRARLPSAAVFYRPPSTRETETPLLVYSPFVINQEANRPIGGDRRKAVWGLIPNSSEISFIDRSDLSTGSSLPWKLAMWGTDRDRRLLEKTQRRFLALKPWMKVSEIKAYEGFQLRTSGDREDVELVSELAGKNLLKVPRNAERLHAFSEQHLERIPPDRAYLRKRGGKAALAVCEPPHVIVGAARTFAVYTDDYLVVPPRQIGISGSLDQSSLLKALALYLSSDFAMYFEFFEAPQAGIVRTRYGTLRTLQSLPIPLADLSSTELREWCELHHELTEASKEHLSGSLTAEGGKPKKLKVLEKELNRKVEAALGLSHRERWLVHDLVHIRMSLTDGKLGEPAVRKPSRKDVLGYGEMLRDELDSFLDPREGRGHRVAIYSGGEEGFVSVEPIVRSGDSPIPIDIREGGDSVTREMDRLQREHRDITRQWIYFDRNLFVYDRDRTLIFKPQQRIWWTHSQAMSDADEIISAALAPEVPTA